MLYFENAKESFEKAHGSIFGDENAERNFYHKFARMIPDKVDVDTLVLAFKIALQDETREGKNTMGFISVIPQYVRQCTSLEFAHEFREKFNEEVLGLTQEPLPDVDYGYNEVEENVIDISNKNRADVLAALYNASTPVGMGFAQYNPREWTREIAEYYFENYVEPKEDGTIFFKYIMGRPVTCTFVGDLVYVGAYNYENEPGLAQRAISTCPNKEKTNTKQYQVKKDSHE